jgi:hypothetical protein
LTIAEHNESSANSAQQNSNATCPERRESFAHQKKILLSHTQKIAFQSTAFWAIHPEAIMLLRKVAKRASNRLKQPCLPRQGKRRERPTWDEKSL